MALMLTTCKHGWQALKLTSTGTKVPSCSMKQIGWPDLTLVPCTVFQESDSEAHREQHAGAPACKPATHSEDSPVLTGVIMQVTCNLGK